MTVELLNAKRLAPPLALLDVGRGRDVLVVENSDPFWVCCEQAARLEGRVGLVGFGAGNVFPATVASLASRGTPARVFYWGDLDPEGVRIAALAAKVGAGAGLAVVPAWPFWEAQAALEPTDLGCHSWDNGGREWFGCDLWAASAAVRDSGGRVAQERLGPADVAGALSRLGVA